MTAIKIAVGRNTFVMLVRILPPELPPFCSSCAGLSSVSAGIREKFKRGKRLVMCLFFSLNLFLIWCFVYVSLKISIVVLDFKACKLRNLIYICKHIEFETVMYNNEILHDFQKKIGICSTILLYNNIL